MVERTQIGDYVVTRIVTGVQQTNAYIVYHEPSNEMLLIDPGDEPRKVSRTLNEFLGELRYILLTHVHHEHAGAAARLSEEYSVPCAFQKGDLRLMRMMPQLALQEAGRMVEAPMAYRAFDGDVEFFFAGEQFFAMHTPGHTAGSVCFRFNGFMFTGDMLSEYGKGDAGGPFARPDKMDESIRKIFEVEDKNMLLFPGRGNTCRLQAAKKALKTQQVFELELQD